MTDLALQVSKVTAWALGQMMEECQEFHLLLNLAEIKEANKVCFLDATISQAGLFGNTVKDFALQFSAVQKQKEAVKHILPRRDAAATRPVRAALQVCCALYCLSHSHPPLLSPK